MASIMRSPMKKRTENEMDNEKIDGFRLVRPGSHIPCYHNNGIGHYLQKMPDLKLGLSLPRA